MGIKKSRIFLHRLRQDFTLENATREDFAQSQWPVRPVLYVVYRVILAVYFAIWFVISPIRGGGMIEGGGENFMEELELLQNGSNETMHTNRNLTTDSDLYMRQQPKWWWVLFLTNWTFTVFNVYLMYAAVNVTNLNWRQKGKSYYSDNGQSTSSLPLTCRIHWVLYNTSTALNIIVCIGFWVLLVPFSEKIRNDLNVVSIHVHLVNGIISVVELFVVQIPIKLPHAFHGFSVPAVYIIFSAIYWASGGKPYPIYGFLAYEERPGMTVGMILGLAFVVFPVLWLSVWGLHELRKYAYRKWFPILEPAASDKPSMYVVLHEVQSKSP